MKFCIQDPSWPNSQYLLEQIIDSSSAATAGGAAFAFASPGGVKLLLKDPSFSNFLSRAPFDLLVGVDAITNIAALDKLNACMEEFPRLSVRVFLNRQKSSLFHPKFCWFREDEKTTSLVGSGNLTPGGLRGNREAFFRASLAAAESVQFHGELESWLLSHADNLLDPSDPLVIGRASLNTGKESLSNWAHDTVVENDDGAISVSASRNDADVVLIAEIPRSGDRWNQANFDLDTFKNFFGATPGLTERIILTHINEDGTLGPEEVRPGVAVSSHNFRFELEAASGLRYPENGRPIGVFVRVATRTFRYRLLMPGTTLHTSAAHYLDVNCPRQSHALRRFTTTVGPLRDTDFFSGLAEAADNK